MNKYKIGDWVVVSDTVCVGDWGDDICSFIEPMCQFKGNAYKIKRVTERGGYLLEADEDYWIFYGGWLKPYVQPVAIAEDVFVIPPLIDIKPKHSHYFKNVSHLEELDVYRLIELYAITDPCIQHMLKKCLVVGGRGSKDALRDVQDIIDTAERWKQMQQENALLVK